MGSRHKSWGWGTAHHSHMIHFFVPREESAVCGSGVFRRFAQEGKNDVTRVGPGDCPTCWNWLSRHGDEVAPGLSAKAQEALAKHD